MDADINTDHLGKYRLDGIIGKGAMGIVYKGFDEAIERPVAVKVLHSHLLGEEMGEELATRFRLEAKAAAHCMHANIVTVFDYGVSDDAHYIVMEYIEGVDLKTLLRQEKRMSFRQASDTIFQVLSALEHAHRNGVVHRDIKPANIMVLDNGQVKVADFGVARLASSDLTQAGFMIGTPGYMSPEGRSGDKVDNKADLYAVGVVFYELLTGQRLKLQRPDKAGLRAELEAAVGEPETANKLAELLETVLQDQPQLRYQDAAEFSRCLGSILSPEHRHIPDTEELAATVMRTARRPIAALRHQGSDNPGAKDATEISPSVMAQVEKALVVYVGPMASLLVRKYASQYRDIDSLLDALSTHIPNLSEQTQFRSSLDVSGLNLANTGSHNTTAGSNKTRKPAISLTDTQQQEISRLLAQFIGPLASRLVMRSQRLAEDLDDLRRRLAENIADERERGSFLQQLNQLLQD